MNSIDIVWNMLLTNYNSINCNIHIPKSGTYALSPNHFCTDRFSLSAETSPVFSPAEVDLVKKPSSELNSTIYLIRSAYA